MCTSSPWLDVTMSRRVTRQTYYSCEVVGMVCRREIGPQLADHPGEEPRDLRLREPERAGDRLLGLVLAEAQSQQLAVPGRETVEQRGQHGAELDRLLRFGAHA